MSWDDVAYLKPDKRNNVNNIVNKWRNRSNKELTL